MGWYRLLVFVNICFYFSIDVCFLAVWSIVIFGTLHYFDLFRISEEIEFKGNDMVSLQSFKKTLILAIRSLR